MRTRDLEETNAQCMAYDGLIGAIIDQRDRKSWTIMASGAQQQKVPFAARYVGGMKCMGLFATEDIPRGSPIFSEEVMVVDKTLKSLGGSLTEYNTVLKQELHAVKEPGFARDFFKLPRFSKAKWGPLAAFFERGSIPEDGWGKQLRVLGLTSAYLNHACIPNAQHTLVRGMYGEEEINRLVVFACTHISAEEEITVGYGYLHMDVA